MLYTASKMHWQMLVAAPALRIDLYLVRSIKKNASSNYRETNCKVSLFILKVMLSDIAAEIL